MPSLGADMEAGVLVEWKVKPGDLVKRGDIVAVVETQKGAIDVEIFEDGRIEALLVQPGTTVPVGTVLARLAGGPAREVPAPIQAPARAPAEEPPRRRVSPAARAAARELGVPLEEVQGTGPGGAVTREDVEQAAARRAAPKRPQPAARAGMRQAISAAMARSKREIPHYYLSTRVDLGRSLEWLRKHNEPLKPASRLLPLTLFLKAVALGTRKVPEMNGFYQAGELHPGAGVHLGVAISLREGGLVVPALHDVDQKPLDVLGAELTDLVERARRGQLRSSELSDATLTVTSLGERGADEVFGVIFPPQVALVGFGRVVQAPSVIDGSCVARDTVAVTLAADHRVSDGHRGGLFLSEIDALLQRPEAL